MPAKKPLDVRLMRLLRGMIGCLMLLTVSINCANVVGRYVFLKPFVWAEEVMQFLHLWMVMLGATVLTSQGAHLKMDAVYLLAGPQVRRVLDMVTNLLGVLVSLALVVSATQIIQMLAANDQRSVIARVPMALVYAVIPLSFGCGILLLGLWFTRLWRGQGAASAAEGLAAPPEAPTRRGP
jgi:TRAP-type C4-dicarboxylate transport system permease small subunit